MTRYTLAQLRQRYIAENRSLGADVEAELREDGRAGAKAILAAVSKRRRSNRSEGQRIRHLMRFETALWSAGIENVAGVDEAGMSPLAGPVAAAAVILPPGCRINRIDDSKKLDACSREALAAEIKSKATAWSVGFATGLISTGPDCSRCDVPLKAFRKFHSICCWMREGLRT